MPIRNAAKFFSSKVGQMSSDEPKITNKEDLKKRVETEPDFINSKKYGYSYSAFIEKNSSNRNNDKLICLLLVLEPDELNKIWKSIIEKGRRYFNIGVD